VQTSRFTGKRREVHNKKSKLQGKTRWTKKKQREVGKRERSGRISGGGGESMKACVRSRGNGSNTIRGKKKKKKTTWGHLRTPRKIRSYPQQKKKERDKGDVEWRKKGCEPGGVTILHPKGKKNGSGPY